MSRLNAKARMNRVSKHQALLAKMAEDNTLVIEKPPNWLLRAAYLWLVIGESQDDADLFEAAFAWYCTMCNTSGPLHPEAVKWINRFRAGGLQADFEPQLVPPAGHTEDLLVSTCESDWQYRKLIVKATNIRTGVTRGED